MAGETWIVLRMVTVAAKPDIVALEEVDQGTKRASGVDQPAEGRVGLLGPVGPVEQALGILLGDVPWGQWIGALTDAGYDGPVFADSRGITNRERS